MLLQLLIELVDYFVDRFDAVTNVLFLPFGTGIKSRNEFFHSHVTGRGGLISFKAKQLLQQYVVGVGSHSLSHPPLSPVILCLWFTFKSVFDAVDTEYGQTVVSQSDPAAEEGAGGDDEDESVEKKRTSHISNSKKGTAPDPDDKDCGLRVVSLSDSAGEKKGSSGGNDEAVDGALNLSKDSKEGTASDIDEEQLQSISAREFLRGKPETFESNSNFEDYVQVAAYLLSGRWYLPLLKVIVECYRAEKTFIVVDCASGAGKSQLAVALIIFAESKAKLRGLPLLVAHIVWTSARSSQNIYEATYRYQNTKGISTKTFFKDMQSWMELNEKFEEIDTYYQSLWDKVLKNMFQNETFAEFQGKLCILVLDELPTEADLLVLVGRIRDALKMLTNIVLILSGTNSKAANMIGLSRGDATSSDVHVEHSKWSFLITRVPQYLVQASPQVNKWEALKSKVETMSPDLANAFNAIRISMENQGNPRLIEFAILTLAKLESKQEPFQFENWQIELATENIKSKFLLSKLSSGKEILISQINLLLSASAEHDIADSMIHRHYAQRAFPDNGTHFGLAKYDDPCGGWLYISPNTWRCLGHALYARSGGEPPKSSRTASNWQVTVFQTLANDPILYLASCWEGGYFSIFHAASFPASINFTALTVMNSVWKPNTVGGLNFQNPVACINTGARLEVAVILSIMNAGAMHSDPRMPLVTFIGYFLKQLDMAANVGIMSRDPAFENLFVPRWIFPVIDSSTKVLPNIGVVTREPNCCKRDATLHNVQGKNKLGVKVESIKFEMKDWKSAVTTTLIFDVAAKLIQSEGEIGILCVRKSAQLWTDQSVREILWRELKKIEDLGWVYLICKKENLCHKLRTTKKARLVVVVVDDLD